MADISDIISNLDENANPGIHSETEYLHHIDDTLDEIVKTLNRMSQTSARDYAEERSRNERERSRTQSTYQNTQSQSSRNTQNQRSTTNGNRYDSDGSQTTFKDIKDMGKKVKGSVSSMLDDFLDTFESEFLHGVLGFDLQDKIKESLSQFEESIGMSLEDIPKEFGKELGKKLSNSFNDSKFGNIVKNAFERVAHNTEDQFKKGFESAANNFRNWGESSSEHKEKEDEEKAKITWDDVFKKAKSAQSEASSSKNSGATGAAEAASEASSASTAEGVASVLSAGEGAAGALGGVAKAALSLAPELLAVFAASKLVSKLMDKLKEVGENIVQVGKDIVSSSRRNFKSATQAAKNASERMQSDVETMVKRPFEILEEAAEELYDTWDQYLREINGTQGYTKSDLQDLMSAYSKRLEDEGLSAVVSTSEITENLAQVLNAGLSGQAAEEFAYLATVLNAAIPTEDFFQYADTYAQIANLAMQSGMSQSEAIAYANSQLEDFANSILYANRELSGGFTTGLTNASDLLASSVSIAQMAGSTNYSGISAALAATSAYVGAIAPSLTDSITDLIVQLATGGNSSELTALRSLAGTGASNTAFLNAFVNNPQEVLTTLFTNLGSMQNMSNNAYMEVAEGLSSLFGISMEALAQIDFKGLANAISSMTTGSSSLDENLSLLASGETTTSAEAEKIAQINQYMADEGLSYVLDNEAARAVQQHMWDEEIANSLMEAEYAVALRGDALTALTSIQNLLTSLKNIFTGKWITNIATNVKSTVEEAESIDDDVREMLEAGKVGEGDTETLYKLSTYDSNYQSDVSDLLTVMTDTQALYSSGAGLSDALAGNISKSVSNALQTSLNTNRVSTGVNSMYSWGTVSKSTASSLNALSGGTATGNFVTLSALSPNVSSASAEILYDTQARIDSMLDEAYIQSFLDEGKTYEDWVASATNFGIADFESAVEDVGYDIEKIEYLWSQMEDNMYANETNRRNQREEEFWDNTEYWEADISEFFEENNDLLDYANELMETCNEILEEIYQKNSDFYDAWVDYYVKHTAYSNSYDHTAVAEIQEAEKNGSSDAIYALAEVLTQNSVDLLDPTVQTNALLSQILIVVNAIMQQNNTATGNLSLSDTLSGLALGIINTT